MFPGRRGTRRLPGNWRPRSLRPMTDTEELVDAYCQPLYCFAISLVRDADRAAGLVRQTYVIWERKEREPRAPGKVRTGLFSTLYRQHLGQGSWKTWPPEPATGDDEDRSATHEPDPGREIPRTAELLGGLSTTFRAPLTLFCLEQHSYKEIADILDVPIGTVMSRISRGKEQLRSRMMEEPASAGLENFVDFRPDVMKQPNG